jgi:arsenate reductase
LLKDRQIPYRYRDYREELLSAEEIRSVLRKLGVGPGRVLRRNDAAFKKLGLTGQESDDRLVSLMAEHPTLLQRPIGVLGDRAVVGRPPENLLDLAE